MANKKVTFSFVPNSQKNILNEYTPALTYIKNLITNNKFKFQQVLNLKYFSLPVADKYDALNKVLYYYLCVYGGFLYENRWNDLITLTKSLNSQIKKNAQIKKILHFRLSEALVKYVTYKYENLRTSEFINLHAHVMNLRDLNLPILSFDEINENVNEICKTVYSATNYVINFTQLMTTYENDMNIEHQYNILVEDIKNGGFTKECVTKLYDNYQYELFNKISKESHIDNFYYKYYRCSTKCECCKFLPQINWNKVMYNWNLPSFAEEKRINLLNLTNKLYLLMNSVNDI